LRLSTRLVGGSDNYDAFEFVIKVGVQLNGDGRPYAGETFREKTSTDAEVSKTLLCAVPLDSSDWLLSIGFDGSR
jgi:hypothetical protein